MKINQLLTNVNFNDSNRKDSQIKYIVVHYVGATGGAKDNCKYFEWTYRGASAHYFVGHQGEIWQCVLDEDVAWHSGTTGTYYHPYCRNSNAIGVEMCCRVKSDGTTWYFEQDTVDATVELVKYLMEKYNIPVENVVRHYDVTHKSCPRPYVINTSAWNAFKARLTDGTTPTIEQEQPTTKAKYKVGDKVSTTKLATNVNGGKVYTGKWSGTITRVIEGKAYPYLLNNGTGWTNDEGIVVETKVETKPVETPTTTAPLSGTKYKVGDVVKINGIYTSSNSTNKLTPANKSGKITSILQGAKNPYLLDYYMGWVNDSVIVTESAATAASTIKVGSKVKVTNPVDYNGTKIYVSGTYDVIEVSGNRVVIGKGKTVTAAMHKNNLKLV